MGEKVGLVEGGAHTLKKEGAERGHFVEFLIYIHTYIHAVTFSEGDHFVEFLSYIHIYRHILR